MYASRVADLECLGAHLRQAEWQDFDLLEATVDNNSRLDTGGIQRHCVRQDRINTLDEELLKQHVSDDLGHLAYAAQSLAKNDTLVFRADL